MTEFGLPTRKHLVHKAIEPRKLSAKIAEAVAARTNDLWEVKYDGCHAILIKVNGVAYGFSRQGEPIAGAMDRQLVALEQVPADNFVLFAEAWAPNLIHSIINGDFRRGYEADEPRTLKAVVFDFVPWEYFLRGSWRGVYEDRHQRVHELVSSLRNRGHRDIFCQAFVADSKAECVAYVADRQDNHGEVFAIDGFMRKARLGEWNAGAGSDGSILKDKDLLSVDLKVVDLFEGQGKFAGTLGGYICEYQGQVQRVGGGKLTNKQRDAIWADKTCADGGIGSIIEVHALGESTNGLLREPRYARTRLDKTEGE